MPSKVRYDNSVKPIPNRKMKKILIAMGGVTSLDKRASLLFGSLADFGLKSIPKQTEAAPYICAVNVYNIEKSRPYSKAEAEDVNTVFKLSAII